MTLSEHQELQYLNLVSTILSKGEKRNDRTGTGTLSVFAPEPLRFNLRDCFPLLTTKRVFFRGVVEELLWFIKGDTNALHLEEKGIHIWDGNGTREYLDSIGLTDRKEMDLGPVYGFQWRHFGAKYLSCDDCYDGQGVDQLKSVVEKITKNPYDRRIIMSAWNPSDLSIMALPPCHMFCQFYVSFSEQVPRLSCQMYQRSVDTALGLPFNIASYALLTIIVAHACNIGVGDLIITMGDAHVYLDHIAGMKIQLGRSPVEFPRLKIKIPPGGGLDSMMELKYEDFELMDYKPHGKIEMKMSV